MTSKERIVWILLFSAVFLAFYPAEVAARSRTIRLMWEELSPWIVGEEIQIKIPNGPQPRDQVLNVTTDSLSLDRTIEFAPREGGAL